MVPVLPVLVPQVVGVKATADQAGDNSAVNEIVSSVLGRLQQENSSRPLRREKHIQDRQLAP